MIEGGNHRAMDLDTYHVYVAVDLFVSWYVGAHGCDRVVAYVCVLMLFLCVVTQS